MPRFARVLVLLWLSLVLTACGTQVSASQTIPSRTSLALLFNLPKPINDFQGMTFVDRSHGFLLGTTAPFSPTATRTFAPYATSDSGATWRQLPFSAGWDPQALYFASPALGFAIAESPNCLTNTGTCRGAILSTRNGGNAWQRARVPSLLYSVVWSDGARAMVAGSAPCLSVGCHPVSVLLRTEDAGTTWQPIGPPGSQPLFSGVSFSTAHTGLGIDQSGQIFSTDDGGLHWSGGQKLLWQGQPPAVGAAQFSVVGGVAYLDFCNTQTVGNGGCVNVLYRSADAGRHWRMVYTIGCVQTSELHMTSALDGTLTTFGWTACQSPVPPDTSAIWRTTDGGSTFQVVKSFAPDTLVAQGFLGGETSWLAAVPPNCYPGSGPCGPIISWSSDAGKTWRQVFPKIAPTEAIAGTGDGPVYGLGTALDPRAVLRLGPAGTWQSIGSVPSLGAPLMASGSLAFSSARVGYLGGADGYLLRTQNGGRSWARVSLPAGLAYYAAMAALPSGSLMYAAEPTLCDGERNCRTELLDIARGAPHARLLHRFPPGWQLQGMAFTSPSRGYALGYDCNLKGPSCGSALFVTQDGGTSWQRSSPPHQGNYLDSPAPGVLAITGPSYYLLHGPGNRTWREYAQKHPIPLYTPQFVQIVLRGKDVWMLSGDGVLYESLNGGRTWH